MYIIIDILLSSTPLISSTFTLPFIVSIPIVNSEVIWIKYYYIVKEPPKWESQLEWYYI
jgi:hypothetical protein